MFSDERAHLFCIAISENDKIDLRKISMGNKRYTLILEPTSNRIDISENTNIYDAMVALNFPIGALCGGKGSCGKCVITIDKNNINSLSKPTDLEVQKLGINKLQQGLRLACQSYLSSNCRIYLSDSLIPKGNRILVHTDMKALGIDENIDLLPSVNSRKYKISSPSIDNPRDDFSGLIAAIRQGGGDLSSKVFSQRQIDSTLINIVKKLPKSMRDNNGNITAYFRRLRTSLNQNIESDWDLFDVESGNRTDKLYGLAVDIGTTTIVGYLINLLNGETAAITALLNPQVAIGEDLVSRISYIKNNNAIEKAKKYLMDALNKIIFESRNKANISSSDIKDIVVVGNTGMHHMFFGLETEFLALSPYVPAVKSPINIIALELKLNCEPNVNVYSPPVIAGYVGTDTIGCILSSRLNKFDEYSLLIDIGTNGELVMGNKNSISTASCAAGSALEGAHINFGMRAAEGAIETVTIEKSTLNPKIGVIGDRNPIGICGSGLIDVVAEMLKSQILTRSGRFNIKDDQIKNNKRIVKKDDGYHYILFYDEWDNLNSEESEELLSIKQITVSQDDVHQVQLAKGAFLSASFLLLDAEKKISTNIEQVILAGGFGTYINKGNAAFIGLFPEIENDRIFQIGNAAGEGAKLCLKNSHFRDLANELAFKVKYHEIASLPTFQKEYAYSLYFPHFDLDRFPTISNLYKNIPKK